MQVEDAGVYCIDENSTIKDVIEKFENNKERVVFVVNDIKKIIGVVSQGDIIRFLANSGEIYSDVTKIMTSSFFYLSDYNLNRAYEVFRRKKITALPVVDDDFKLIDIITLDNIYKFLEAKER
jgi:putative CBS domain protein